MTTSRPDPHPTDAPVVGGTALKEWAAAVAALLSGRQSILLRKGGVHEKRFVPPTVGSGVAIPLFPTTAHAHRERLRPEFRDLVPATAEDSTERAVVLRAAVVVTDVIEVVRPEAVAALEPFHPWTTESVRADRIDFRPRRALTVLVVRTYPLRPLVLPRTPADSGCRSWVDLDTRPVLDGPAVRSPTDPDEVARAVRAAVG